MNKKAQIQSQVFIYVLSLIIIAMIFLFGYRAIGTIQERARRIEIERFKSELTDAVTKTSYESSRNVVLNIPSGFTKICLADKPFNPLNLPDKARYGDDAYPLIVSAIDDGTANAFLIRHNEVQELFDMGNATIVDSHGAPIHYDCKLTLGARLRVNVLGKGDHSEVKFID